jgi:RNA polymerase sigma-70 factor (ECF subfamily)
VNSALNQSLSERQRDFDETVSRYSPVFFHIALGRLRNVEDAEDAVQEALLSAYKHLGQFQGRSQLSSWLTKIVINTAGMKLRGRRHQKIVSLDQILEAGGTTLATELVDTRQTPEAVCAQTEMGEILRKALTQLSPKLRVAFQMRKIAGISDRQIAETLGLTTNALKSRVARARAAISSYIDKIHEKHLVNISRESRTEICSAIAKATTTRPANRFNAALCRQESVAASTDTKVSTIPSSNCFAFIRLI